ncbi:hypothetical protein [Brazilian marseillevirus]|uniref:hypothetical protein n=1 Tax=Brazilian marseillevirus TaxID=1813599 RepID=UPI000783F0FD|nr:hypothetical protein A3303_gp139 [Brazilian marseillevirus]AMQ10647.1 hypothetical protein [Brazilian marseillevirus]
MSFKTAMTNKGRSENFVRTTERRSSKRKQRTESENKKNGEKKTGNFSNSAR